MKPKVLIFASGSRDGGGSGFLHLVLNSLSGVLPVEIVGVVSNHENGGVRRIANDYQIRFFLLKSFDLGDYCRIIVQAEAEWFLLSGWLKFVYGLDPRCIINIHPGPTKDFGGDGMHGHHVHQAVLDAQAKFTAVTMHFVTEDGYDTGPTFFEYPLAVCPKDDVEALAARVNRYEHGWQSFVTWLVVSGQIYWDGIYEVHVPEWYKSMPFCPPRLKKD